jgi:mRNA-degrading endonuclease RelE of RelBE toxin-antitoxin system
MAYQVEIGSHAEAQFGQLDSRVAASIERKIVWLATNASDVIHRRLVGMPAELEGLCKRRIGGYRVLYWVCHVKKLPHCVGFNITRKSTAISDKNLATA